MRVNERVWLFYSIDPTPSSLAQPGVGFAGAAPGSPGSTTLANFVGNFGRYGSDISGVALDVPALHSNEPIRLVAQERTSDAKTNLRLIQDCSSQGT